MADKTQRGDFINLTAPSGGYTSGEVVIVNGMVGVVKETVAEGVLVGAEVVGVYGLTKETASDVFAQGEDVFVDADGDAHKASATGRVYAGKVWEDSASGDTLVETKLNANE